MTTLEILGGAANGLFVLFCVIVGLRLLWLARRTRALPELLIGAAFTTIGLVGFPLMAASGFGRLSAGEINIPMLVIAQISLAFSIIAVFSFTWRVFRPKVRWAAALTGLSAMGVGLIVFMTVRSIISSPADMSSLDAAGPWSSAFRLPFGVWYGWTAYESLRCYAQGRRRLALGLSDPVVINRFLLWGSMGALESVANIGALTLELQGLSPFTNPAGAMIMALNGLLGTGLMFLTFMPPDAYRRFVERRAAR